MARAVDDYAVETARQFHFLQARVTETNLISLIAWNGWTNFPVRALAENRSFESRTADYVRK